MSWTGAFALFVLIFCLFENWLFGHWAKNKAKHELAFMRSKGLTATSALQKDVEKDLGGVDPQVDDEQRVSGKPSDQPQTSAPGSAKPEPPPVKMYL